MNGTAKKTRKASKKQQTFQLPEPAIAWLHKEEHRTGANISRHALAAVVAYSELDATDRAAAMADAMEVEAGEKTI